MTCTNAFASAVTAGPRAPHVLVVEDDAALRELAGLVLEQEGYAVTSACNAAEALAALQHQAFDLLFSDVLMPGDLDGTALAELAESRWPTMSVLLTSGFFDHAQRAASRWGLLPKPYEPAVLLREVHRILGCRHGGG